MSLHIEEGAVDRVADNHRDVHALVCRGPRPTRLMDARSHRRVVAASRGTVKERVHERGTRGRYRHLDGHRECADGWALGVRPDCWEARSVKVPRSSPRRWPLGQRWVSLRGLSRESRYNTGMPLETARRLAWFLEQRRGHIPAHRATARQPRPGSDGPPAGAGYISIGIEADGTFGPGTESAVHASSNGSPASTSTACAGPAILGCARYSF